MINKYESLKLVDWSSLSFYDNAESLRNSLIKKHDLIVHDNGIDLKVSAIEHGFIKLTFKSRYPSSCQLFCNGLQSWSASRFYNTEESLPQLRSIASPIWRHYKMQYYGDYFLKKKLRVKDKLSSYGYSVWKIDSQVVKVSDNSSSVGIGLFVYLPQDDELVFYKEIGPGVNHITLSETELNKKITLAPPVTGWTSWYNYYGNINQELINEQLQHFIDYKVPLQYFQIDDGWQKNIGDWLPNNNFKNLKDIPKLSAANSTKAGLWLAPFVASQKSDIYINKKSWLKLNGGKTQLAGYNPGWGGNFYCLDWRNAEVQSYLKHTFDRVINEWGFRLLKLDFLYAAALENDIPSGYAYSDAIDFIRDITVGAELILCGAYLDINTQDIDYIRIGGDVDMQWNDNRLSNILQYRERVSTRDTLKNTIYRRLLGEYNFKLDPDVYILRSGNHKLSDYEKQTLFRINLLLGDVLFCSDDYSKYDEETKLIYNNVFNEGAREIVDWSFNNDAGYVDYKWNERYEKLYINLSDINVYIKEIDRSLRPGESSVLEVRVVS